MTVPITIKNIEGASELSEWASKQSFEIYVSSENIMINAKSALGIYALIGHEVNLVVGDHVPVEKFTKALKELMI